MNLVTFMLALQDDPWTFVALLVGVALLLGIHNRLQLGRYWSGLFPAQLALAFNAAVVGHLYLLDEVSGARVAHFVVVEGSVYLVLAWQYRQLARDRHDIIDAVNQFIDRHGKLVTGVLVGLTTLNLVFVPRGGESRLLHQTAYWFSLVRPIQSFLLPVASLAVFAQLAVRRRGTALKLTALLAAQSISSGSKGFFLISLAMWALVLRDMGATFGLRRRTYLAAGVLGFAMTLVNVVLVNTSLTDLTERFVAFGDAAMMVYPAVDPTAACANVSVLTSMHRGLARLLGDRSAADIDTLFGFALTIEAYGENSLTGPNARIGPYALCAFPSWSIVLLALVAGLYLGAIRYVTGTLQRRLDSPTCTALVFPFAITSVNGFAIDYYQALSDLTALVLFTGALLVFSALRRRASEAAAGEHGP